MDLEVKDCIKTRKGKRNKNTEYFIFLMLDDHIQDNYCMSQKKNALSKLSFKPENLCAQ